MIKFLISSPDKNTKDLTLKRLFSALSLDIINNNQIVISNESNDTDISLTIGKQGIKDVEDIMFTIAIMSGTKVNIEDNNSVNKDITDNKEAINNNQGLLDESVKNSNIHNPININKIKEVIDKYLNGIDYKVFKDLFNIYLYNPSIDLNKYSIKYDLNNIDIPDADNIKRLLKIDGDISLFLNFKLVINDDYSNKINDSKVLESDRCKFRCDIYIKEVDKDNILYYLQSAIYAITFGVINTAAYNEICNESNLIEFIKSSSISDEDASTNIDSIKSYFNYAMKNPNNNNSIICDQFIQWAVTNLRLQIEDFNNDYIYYYLTKLYPELYVRLSENAILSNGYYTCRKCEFYKYINDNDYIPLFYIYDIKPIPETTTLPEEDIPIKSEEN